MRGHPKYGSWETPSCYSWISPHSDSEEAVLSLRRFLAHHPVVLASELVERTARCWLFGGATGASAWGVLWSLDVVLTIAACLHCFSGGMIHSVKLIAGQVRIMN